MDTTENNSGISPSCGSQSSESVVNLENNQDNCGELAACERLSVAPSCGTNSSITESEESCTKPAFKDDVTIDMEVENCDETTNGVVTSQTIPRVEMQTSFDGTTTVNALYIKHTKSNSTASICTCPTQSTLTDFCRICHCEGDAELGPLIAPCYCRGSLRYVHQACLQQWIKSSDSKNCELCGYHFVMDSKLKPFHKWKKLSMSTAEHRKIMCSVMFHIIAITCVICSLYILIGKTATEINSGNLQWPFWTKLVVIAIGFTGGLVFMYVQCKVYVQLWKRLKAFNRVIYVQNNSPSGMTSPEEVITPDTAEPGNVAESVGSLYTSEQQFQLSGTMVAESNRK